MPTDTTSHDTDEVPAALPDHLTPEVREALAEAKARLQAAYGGRLRRIVLYGSRARGDARPDSDVDVLVVLSGPLNRYEEYEQLAAVKMDLFERYRLSFSFKPFVEEAYHDMRRPIMQNVRAEGVAL